MWGKYGTPIGIFMTICSFYGIFRTVSSHNFLMVYKNPFVSEKERKRRERIIVRGGTFADGALSGLAAHN
jgi:hypothetical protein